MGWAIPGTVELTPTLTKRETKVVLYLTGKRQGIPGTVANRMWEGEFKSTVELPSSVDTTSELNLIYHMGYYIIDLPIKESLGEIKIVRAITDTTPFIS